MKNVLISLLALAAISGAAFATDRSDSDNATKPQVQSYATASNAIAVANDGAALTAYDHMMKISEENQHGRK